MYFTLYLSPTIIRLTKITNEFLTEKETKLCLHLSLVSPRVGSLRELKFATEKYFRHEISQDTCRQLPKQIRAKTETFK
ncbi:MAG: hypothetical protein ACLVI9_01590 [Anaerostipes hadrus]